jgi:hypothetical protein
MDTPEEVKRVSLAFEDAKRENEGLEDWTAPGTAHIIRSQNQNMVIVLSRFQINEKDYETPLEKIKFDSIALTYKSTSLNADVVIIKDGNQFAVLKHRHMTRVMGQTYHKSSLTNIAFAR